MVEKRACAMQLEDGCDRKRAHARPPPPDRRRGKCQVELYVLAAGREVGLDADDAGPFPPAEGVGLEPAGDAVAGDEPVGDS